MPRWLGWALCKVGLHARLVVTARVAYCPRCGSLV
jgi:hypothetical protein